MRNKFDGTETTVHTVKLSLGKEGNGQTYLTFGTNLGQSAPVALAIFPFLFVGSLVLVGGQQG